MGKYDSVTKDLPKLPPDIAYAEQGGAKYQAKVDDAKANLCFCGLLKDDPCHSERRFEPYHVFKPVERTPSALATMYADLRREADAKEAEAKAIRLRVEAVKQLLTDAFDGEGITSLDLRGVGSFRLQSEPYTHVTDRTSFLQWCRDNGFEDQLTLPWQTTNMAMKEELLAGKEPPECVGVYLKTTPYFTREK